MRVLATTRLGACPEVVVRWARRLARHVGGETSLDASASLAELLDVVGKRAAGGPDEVGKRAAGGLDEVAWLVTGADASDVQAARGPAHERWAALLTRVPCPCLTVSPWMSETPNALRTAVVGVERSPRSRAAALAASALLSGRDHDGGTRRLLLVHGYRSHPADLAVHRRWRDVTDAMRPERHPWLEALARELRTPRVRVEVRARAVWAPQLIAGTSQREGADFVALGVPRATEHRPAPLPSLLTRLARSLPCPMLTAAESPGAR